MKRAIYILLLVCVGVVLGSLTATLTAGVPWLGWLSYGREFGLTSPFVLDLGVIVLTFAIKLDLTVSVIIFTAAALAVGTAVRRGKT